MSLIYFQRYKYNLFIANLFIFRIKILYKFNLIDKVIATERFDKWIGNTFKDKLETFYTTANTVKANFDNILNFFNNRNTNAKSEQKIKDIETKLNNRPRKKFNFESPIFIINKCLTNKKIVYVT